MPNGPPAYLSLVFSSADVCRLEHFDLSSPVPHLPQLSSLLRLTYHKLTLNMHSYHER